jgi:transposase-like protein
MDDALNKVLKRLHYPLDIMLTCVRWYVAYPLSLRHIEEMMHERGIFVDHTTIHRWALKILPVLAAAFRRRKRPVGDSWRMNENYVLVGGRWKYFDRAIDRDGATVDFLLTIKRDLGAARRFLERAIDQHCLPDKNSIDKSGANTTAVQRIQADTGAQIELRQVKYLNNIVEQDHRAIKRIIRPMLGFPSFRCARILLAGIEAMHRIKKGHLDWLDRQVASAADQFYSLAV